MKKWSALQIGVHIFAWLPLLVLIWAYLTNNLTVNPVQAGTQRLGDTALVMLLLSLACTPLNTLFGLKELLRLRRPLGLYAFFYAGLHVLAYVGWDYGFHFSQVAIMLTGKPYLLFGMAALTILVPLAFTSHIYWKKYLGKAWKTLHRFIYLAAVLAVLHLSLIVKGDVFQLRGDIWKPFSAGLTLALFLLARIPPVRKVLSNVRFISRSRQLAARERGDTIPDVPNKNHPAGTAKT